MDGRFNRMIDKFLSTLACKVLYYRDQLSKVLTFLADSQYFHHKASAELTNV
jgi:hypothetical protein